MAAKARIRPHSLHGKMEVPPSKSHTLRALLFAMMAKGTSRIENFLPSPDTAAMVDAIRQLGAQVKTEGNAFLVEGVAGKPHPPSDVIHCGNSGQVLRFIGALSSLLSSYAIFTGDVSIRQNRPVKPLLDGLTQLGAFAESSRLDGCAPILIKGPLKGGKAIVNGEDSQPISGLLIAGAFAASPLELEVINPGEKPWVNLTLHWFDRLGIPYENHQFERYKMRGNAQIEAFHYSVPGDFSSAAFPLAAALLTQSELVLGPLDRGDPQGDQALLPVLEKMGARFETKGLFLRVKKSPPLKGMRIDINDFIDALPILAVIGCFAEGQTEIVNGAIARRKESDRIRCIAAELKKMGADIEERPDGLLIRKSRLHGALNLESHQDHRIALSLAVAAMAAQGDSVIHGIECIAKTYPAFFSDLRAAGADIEVET